MSRSISGGRHHRSQRYSRRLPQGAGPRPVTIGRLAYNVYLVVGVRRLQLADLREVDEGLRITLGWSKTDQDAAGVIIGIPRGRGTLHWVHVVGLQERPAVLASRPLGPPPARGPLGRGDHAPPGPGTLERVPRVIIHRTSQA